MSSKEIDKKGPPKSAAKEVRVRITAPAGVETSRGTSYPPAVMTLPEAEAEKLAKKEAVKILPS